MVKRPKHIPAHLTLLSNAPVDAQRPSVPLPWEQETNDASNEGLGGTPGGVLSRQRVRHSFDIFADQLLSLRDIALRREHRLGGRVRLGDLVQEALDRFIAREESLDVQGPSGAPPTRSEEAPPDLGGGASDTR